jgi:hypothetical protein
MYFVVGGFFYPGLFCFGARLALSRDQEWYPSAPSPFEVQNRVDFLCETAY